LPERGASYEEQVWNRLAPKIGRKRECFSWPRRQGAVAAGMLALALIAFTAGRYSSPPQRIPQMAAQAPIRERILIVAVGDHLDRLQMILAELVNAESGSQLDISDERALAETLLDANRLYRQTATAAGERGVASVLEELERVLLEVSHSSSTLSPAELEELRHRIESQALLFKVRVVGSQPRERGAKPAVPGGSKRI